MAGKRTTTSPRSPSGTPSRRPNPVPHWAPMRDGSRRGRGAPRGLHPPPPHAAAQHRHGPRSAAAGAVVGGRGARGVVGAPVGAWPAAPLGLPVALATGGVAAAVLAAMALARALRRAVTAEVEVPEAEVRAYYDRSRDRYTRS